MRYTKHREKIEVGVNPEAPSSTHSLPPPYKVRRRPPKTTPSIEFAEVNEESPQMNGIQLTSPNCPCKTLLRAIGLS